MRRRSGTVEVDIADIIEAIDDDDLLEEVKARGLARSVGATDIDIVREAYDALMRRNIDEARCILDRLLFPKWKSVERCKDEYQKTQGQAGTQ